VTTVRCTPRAAGDARCPARAARGAGLLGECVWKGHAV